MSDLKGTKTEKNLKGSFSGESRSRNKYTFYAAKAREEGYEQIADLFLETAKKEKEHAKLWFKLLHDDEIPTTMANLEDAAEVEHYGCTMYDKFAKEAKEEGFDKIAFIFEKLSQIEKEHELKYRKLFENLKNDEVFKKEKPVTWECINCDYSFEGESALEICPVCRYPKAYFQIKARNY
ncbi:MAG: rubrerythrin family protein [Methanobrevibacter sp.]|jgi:rubrerythrin|nr:rubrerythrin family protein [Methanobrevibacter sp.]